MPPFAIAIDGPAASGKSSTAKRVAAALGAHHVDSGGLYRAATAARARLGGDLTQWAEAEVLAAARIVTLAPVAAGFVTLLDGQPVEAELRGPLVTAAVSRVAHFPGVRAWVNAQVQAAAAAHDVVVDGRDIGTAVLPQAGLKVFLIADPAERARRRLLEQTGQEPDASALQAERERLAARDANDADNTLRAADAIEIDTTQLSVEEQVGVIIRLAQARRAS
jgi:cytidylate kinase